jgi:hypothetical protein
MLAAKLGQLSRIVRYSSDTKRRRGSSRQSALTTFRRNGFRAWGAVYAGYRNDDQRGPAAFKAYSEGAFIAPTGGRRWLAFPTANIPKRVGRRKITPALYNSGGLDSSIGPLVFVPGISANVAYLVVKNVGVNRLTGRSARRLPRRGGLGASRRVSNFTVAFILIRTTSRQKRFDPVQLLEIRFSRAPAFFGNEMSRPLPPGTPTTSPIFSSSGSVGASFIPTRRA